MRFLLQHSQHLLPLQGEAPGQNHPQIAAAQDHDAIAQLPMMEIDHFLRLSGRKHTGRTRPRKGEGADCTLPASRRQDQPLKTDLFQPAAAGQDSGLFFCHGQHFPFRQKAHACACQTFRQSLRIGGAGQLLSEGGQAEALMEALRENAARIGQAVCQNHVPATGVPCGTGGGDARGPRADDQQLSPFHDCPPEFPSPVRPFGRR